MEIPSTGILLQNSRRGNPVLLNFILMGGRITEGLPRVGRAKRNCGLREVRNLSSPFLAQEDVSFLGYACAFCGLRGGIEAVRWLVFPVAHLATEIDLMNVTLHPDIEKFVADKVRTGQFSSAEQAVNELLSQLREQDELGPEDLAELRAEVDLGIAEADRGEFVEFTAEEVIAERRAVLAARRGQ
jgi:antitoxin ParD1/3/4